MCLNEVLHCVRTQRTQCLCVPSPSGSLTALCHAKLWHHSSYRDLRGQILSGSYCLWQVWAALMVAPLVTDALGAAQKAKGTKHGAKDSSKRQGQGQGQPSKVSALASES